MQLISPAFPGEPTGTPMKSLYFLAAGAATIGIAAPAAAQYQYPYPQPGYAQPGYAQPVPQPYPGQPGYGYQQPGYAQPYGRQPIGQIINQLLGNRYNVTDRTAVTQCASAAMAQAHARYQPRGYQQNRQGYGYPGYNQGYGQAANMRVTAITDVRRLRSGLRVSGLMSSGMQTGYGAYGGQAYAQGMRTSIMPAERPQLPLQRRPERPGDERSGHPQRAAVPPLKRRERIDRRPGASGARPLLRPGHVRMPAKNPMTLLMNRRP
jgi:hypothetical protein